MKSKTPIPTYSLARFYQWLDHNNRCGKSSTHACSQCYTLTTLSVAKPFSKNKKPFFLQDPN